MGGKPKCFACRTAIDEDGFATGQGREGFSIDPRDLVAALVRARKQLSQMVIAVHGQPPGDMHNRHTESSQVQRKPFKADVHHPWACR
jgi:hypothetical protein